MFLGNCGTLIRKVMHELFQQLDEYPGQKVLKELVKIGRRG
jgi:hypothetical protein